LKQAEKNILPNDTEATKISSFIGYNQKNNAIKLQIYKYKPS